MIRFEPASGRARERCLKVKLTTAIAKPGRDRTKKSTITVTVGRIERSRDGMFLYLEPEPNKLNPILEDKNLTALKRRIMAHVKR